MSVRIVCNAVDQPPPPDLLRQLRGKSLAERAGAATRVILDKPDGAKKLWQDKSLITRLADQLGMFLIGTIEQLPLDDQSESAASRDD